MTPSIRSSRTERGSEMVSSLRVQYTHLPGGGVLVESPDACSWEYVYTCGCENDLQLLIFLNKRTRSAEVRVAHRDREESISMPDVDVQLAKVLYLMGAMMRRKKECHFPWDEEVHEELKQHMWESSYG